MTAVFQAVVHQLRAGDIVLALVLVLAGSWIFSLGLGLLTAGTLRRHLRAFAGFAWQLGILLGLEQAYEFTRGRIPHETDIALLNAYRVLDLEWRHGFFIESRVERFFLQFYPLMNAIDLFYILGHVVVTIGVLTWIYAWHRKQYPFVRNLMMVTTAIALIVFYVYPTAPPRMLGNYGFVDPLLLHNLVGAGGEQANSYTYNPYAAMPSLHVGYALIVAWGVMISTRSRWLRLLAAVYPLLMAFTVVISGNHWLLDVAGAVVTVALSGVIVKGAGVVLSSLRPRVAALARGA